jgi:hypothetical protein
MIGPATVPQHCHEVKLEGPLSFYQDQSLTDGSLERRYHLGKAIFFMEAISQEG